MATLTFGYETNGSLTLGTDVNEVQMSKWASPGAGSKVESITFRCLAWVDGVHAKAVLIKHSDLSVLAVGSPQDVNNGSSTWLTSTFDSPVTLDGNDVGLGVIADGYIGIKYDAGDADQGHYDATNNYAAPAALGAITHSTNKISAYATYTPASGGGGGGGGAALKLIGWATPGSLDANWPFSLLTHLVIEYYMPASPTDMTLVLQSGSSALVQQMVNYAHAAGIKALVDIYTLWDDSEMNNVFADAGLRSDLITSIVDLINTYGLDGISFDWESDVQSNWSAANFTTFITALYAAMPAGRKYIDVTTACDKITVQAACANSYLGSLTPMVYDTTPYPAEWYGSQSKWQTQLAWWAASGVNKSVICGGSNLAWRGGGSDPYNWLSWRSILAGYVPGTGLYHTPPADGQNDIPQPEYPWGHLYGSGFSLQKDKATWCRDNGYGGVMLYGVELDDPNNARCVTRALNALIVGTAPNTDAGPRPIRFQGMKMGSM